MISYIFNMKEEAVFLCEILVQYRSKISSRHIPDDIRVQLWEGTFVLNLWSISTLAWERLSKIMKRLNYDILQHHLVHYIYSYVEWTAAGRSLFIAVYLTMADPNSRAV